MPLTQFVRNTMTDLLVSEEDPAQAFSRDVFTVTSASTQTLPLGAVVFRAKGNTAATYVPITTNAALVNTNEFAILIGDGYAVKPSVDYTATVAKTSLGFVREVYLKGKLIKDWMTTSPMTLTNTDYNNLKHLLKNQLIVVEDTLV